jgi:putative transposase
VHAVLYRRGLVNRGRKRRHKVQGTALSKPLQPNNLWCADYKGEFMLADRRYCYALTITDFASRYLLSCEALSTTQGTGVSAGLDLMRELGEEEILTDRT